MTRFCNGLRERGERPLTADERARVAAARRSWTWTAAARAVLVPCALGVLVPTGLAAQLLPRTAGLVLAGIATAAVVFFLFPAAIAWTFDALRVRRALGADLAGGTVVELGDGARTLAVLPRSSRALGGEGAGEELPRVEMGEAAPAPAEAPTYGVAVEGDVAGAREHGWVRRALAPEEREELRGIAGVLRRAPLRLVAVSTIYALLLGDAARTERTASLALVLAFGVVVLGSGWLRWLRGRALAARLLADESEGWIVRATAGALAGTEVLPGSGAHWTQAGAPAEWRLRAGKKRKR